ncbi:uncharacterized protein TNCV_1375221 [Trichonephila clavipes]|nr:uncharacterized protein TNCV_1375221 [Trichonephila clavipes]
MFNLVCKPDEALASYMASEGIDWKFLPPRAPNFGGLWEAGVKSFKFYLKRVVGRSITSVVEPDLTNLNENSDEAHFWLNSYVNKQNCRIWSEANPQVYVETTLHSEKLTVWCALWAGGILLQKR